MKLPYFDIILSRFESGDPKFLENFHRHVHFGAWMGNESPAEAMEQLTQLMIDLADVQPGQDLLDVGCGFGGTLMSLREQFPTVRLAGLNIDPRQLEIARGRLPEVQFIQGDACAMPCADASFDRVLALECIFHFPSRRAFFEQARRVLRPGGNLTLSDIVLPQGTPPGSFDHSAEMLWGKHTQIGIEEYRALAAEVGLELTESEDISPQVLPTYDFLSSLLGPYLAEVQEVARLSKFFMEMGGFGYWLLKFELKQ
jgi:cyclopropane fatty-acyl-phospholipid synthase-like methyltransferase